MPRHVAFFIPISAKPLQWAELARAHFMPENHPSEQICSLERTILRALCGGGVDSVEWDRLAGKLSEYHWQDPDHKVVYESLRGIRSDDASARRDQLPAQVTRMGFPDVDWSLYLASEDIPEREIEELIRRLKEKTTERS